MNHASSAQVDLFSDQVTAFERHLVESGIRLFKLWFTEAGSIVRAPDPGVVQPAAALFVPSGRSSG